MSKIWVIGTQKWAVAENGWTLRQNFVQQTCSARQDESIPIGWICGDLSNPPNSRQKNKNSIFLGPEELSGQEKKSYFSPFDADSNEGSHAF